MRAIKETAQFRRDLKREAKGRHREFLTKHLVEIVQALADDQPLGIQHRDHALAGQWKDCRDCHLRPDLVLIYRKENGSALHLIRLGSHAELSL